MAAHTDQPRSHTTSLSSCPSNAATTKPIRNETNRTFQSSLGVIFFSTIFSSGIVLIIYIYIHIIVFSFLFPLRRFKEFFSLLLLKSTKTKKKKHAHINAYLLRRYNYIILIDL